ncbi:hypothetical protein LSAT2_013442, partial [Lamellibrachia satsuma]
MSTDSGERPRQETCSQDSARTKDQSPRSDVIEVQQKKVAGWDTLKTFCETTTFHGLRNITEPNDNGARRCGPVEACVAEVAGWVEINQLKLIKEKSEAIIFLTAKQRVDLPAEVSLTKAGH